jgi:hypothetical protein
LLGLVCEDATVIESDCDLKSSRGLSGLDLSAIHTSLALDLAKFALGLPLKAGLGTTG